MSSLQDALDALARYDAGVRANAASANAADAIADAIKDADLGSCTIDVSWLAGDATTIRCACRLTDEAAIRKVLHQVCEQRGLALESPQRHDYLAEHGHVRVKYGPVSMVLVPDGVVCRRVATGTRLVPEHEEAVYEVVCDESEVKA